MAYVPKLQYCTLSFKGCMRTCNVLSQTYNLGMSKRMRFTGAYTKRTTTELVDISKSWNLNEYTEEALVYTLVFIFRKQGIWEGTKSTPCDYMHKTDLYWAHRHLQVQLDGVLTGLMLPRVTACIVKLYSFFLHVKQYFEDGRDTPSLTQSQHTMHCIQPDPALKAVQYYKNFKIIVTVSCRKTLFSCVKVYPK